MATIWSVSKLFTPLGLAATGYGKVTRALSGREIFVPGWDGSGEGSSLANGGFGVGGGHSKLVILNLFQHPWRALEFGVVLKGTAPHGS